METHLVEIFLPVVDDIRLGTLVAGLKEELVARFGGVTAFLRSPGEGLWESPEGVVKDDVVVFEVMTDTLDRQWWSDLRQRLEGELEQEAILIRSHAVETL